MAMRGWTLIMVPLFSVSDPLLEKLTIFFKSETIKHYRFLNIS